MKTDLAALARGASPKTRAAINAAMGGKAPTTKRKRTPGPLRGPCPYPARVESDGSITFTIDALRLPSLANLRDWRVRSRHMKACRGLVSACLLMGGVRAIRFPCAIDIVRVGPRPLDSDNATISGKGIRDAIAEHFGFNDGDPRVTWSVTQAREAYAVRVTIRAVEEQSERGV